MLRRLPLPLPPPPHPPLLRLLQLRLWLLRMDVLRGRGPATADGGARRHGINQCLGDAAGGGRAANLRVTRPPRFFSNEPSSLDSVEFDHIMS